MGVLITRAPFWALYAGPWLLDREYLRPNGSAASRSLLVIVGWVCSSAGSLTGLTLQPEQCKPPLPKTLRAKRGQAVAIAILNPKALGSPKLKSPRLFQTQP